MYLFNKEAKAHKSTFKMIYHLLCHNTDPQMCNSKQSTDNARLVSCGLIKVKLKRNKKIFFTLLIIIVISHDSVRIPITWELCAWNTFATRLVTCGRAGALVLGFWVVLAEQSRRFLLWSCWIIVFLSCLTCISRQEETFFFTMFANGFISWF